jgi:hypothetical protein
VTDFQKAIGALGVFCILSGPSCAEGILGGPGGNPQTGQQSLLDQLNGNYCATFAGTYGPGPAQPVGSECRVWTGTNNLYGNVVRGPTKSDIVVVN